MKPDHGVPSGLLPARSPARSIVPVLIQVPALSAPRRRPGRFAPARRRRRLRREVRLVGSALLLVLTTTLGLLPLCGGRAQAVVTDAAALATAPALASASAPAPAATDDDPIVSLCPTIEPASGEHAACVVLPGFIVPDDRGEEAPHARD